MNWRHGFHLGDWAVYPLEGRLQRGDEVQRVQPKSMDVLLVLAEARTSVVEREELLRRVWGERAVSDEPLTRCIGELRKALGDERKKPDHILTVPKRGYRLIMEPLPMQADESAEAHPVPEVTGAQREKRIRSIRRLVYALLAVAVIAVAVLRFGGDQPEPVPEPIPSSIAVLAFDNMSPDPQMAYIAAGLAEEILHQLAQNEALQVTSRTSSFSFRDRPVDIPTISRQLNAAYLLEGSVRYSNGRYRITAQLIEGEGGTHVWSEAYDRPAADLFEIQDDITRNIVGEISDRIVAAAPRPHATDNPLAFQNFLEARSIERSNGWVEKSRVQQSIELLEAAVAADPDFLDAWILLSDGYSRLQVLTVARKDIDAAAMADRRRHEAADEAVRINADYSETQRLLGDLAEDSEERLAAYARAIDANPNNARPLIGLGILRAERGDIEAAYKVFEKAYELDPLNPQVLDHFSNVLVARTDYVRATEVSRILSAQRTSSLHEQGVSDEVLAALPTRPLNMGFASGVESWRILERCSEGVTLDVVTDATDTRAAAIFSSRQVFPSWCTLIQAIRSDDINGQFVRFKGTIRVSELQGSLKFWMRVDGALGGVGFADGWPNIITEDTDWGDYEVTLYVPDDALAVRVGLLLQGSGDVYIESFEMLISADKTFTDATAL